MYPNEREGTLDKRFAILVNRRTCCNIAWEMKIQNYKETDAVMEIQPQRKTETTLKAVEYEPQLDKLNVESSECSQRTKNSEATMKTNEDNRAEETIIKEKIKARGKLYLSQSIKSHHLTRRQQPLMRIIWIEAGFANPS